MGSPFISLNHDILLLVATYSSKETLATLMSTCRDCYRRCPRLILQDTVRLDGDAKAHKFLRCMRAEGYRRWRYLWSLHFSAPSISSISSHMVGRLSKALPRAVNLERLAFDDSENILSLHPSLPLVLAALPKVKQVIIQPGKHTCEMLTKIIWPLETVELCESTVPDPNWAHNTEDPSPNFNPSALLRKTCDTLRSVRSDYWAEPPSFSDPIYPHVTTLAMTSVYYPDTEAWSLLYPNTKRLDLYSSFVNDEFYRDPDGTIDRYQQEHDAQFAAQLRTGRWAHLESYCGTLVDLYLSGIAGRIDKISTTLNGNELGLLPSIFQHARPRHLDLDMKSTVWHGEVPDILRTPGLDELETLELQLFMILPREQSSGSDLQKSLDDLLSAIRPYRLEHLSLKLHVVPGSLRGSVSTDSLEQLQSTGPSSDSEDETPRPTPPPPPPPTPLARYFDDMDRQALVRTMFDKIPSLQSVVLFIDWESGDEFKQNQVSVSRGSIPSIA
ncbi:hypothetical protein C8Q80DRAFT_1113954 [Daedaleopsis nitida]|nr:hypothetical protein C8Q80DRAFT_1113954 [Daedaleopsis nitida]